MLFSPRRGLKACPYNGVGLTVTGQGTLDLSMTALTVDTGNVVPAPETLSLTGLGLAALAAMARRKKA